MASTPDEFGRYFGAAPTTPADMGPAIGETPPSDDFVRRSKEAAERTDRRWAGKLSPYMQIVTADPGARKEYADKAWQSFLETQEGLADQSKAINAELDRVREASERGMRQAKAERDRFRLASDARLRLAGVPDGQIKAVQAGEAARDKAFNELQAADKGALGDYRKASDNLARSSVAGFFRDERKRLMRMTGVDPLATWGGTSRKKQEADETKTAIDSVVSGLYGDDKGGRSDEEAMSVARNGPGDVAFTFGDDPYKGTIFELRDAREMAEYDRLKATGQYKDDEALRLRAMRVTRGDDEVRKLAWQARRGRDMRLAAEVARKYGGSMDDYYVPTTLADVRAATGDYGQADPKEAMAGYLDSRLAYDREHGSPAERLAAKRRGRYMAARWGLTFDEETVEARPREFVDVPVRTSEGGWFYGAGGWNRHRVDQDGTMWSQVLSRKDPAIVSEIADDRSGLLPTRPGEVVRRTDGKPVTVKAPRHVATGRWSLKAPGRKKDPWALYHGGR